ncbi:MAG: phosphoglucosamine mutase, partial [Candidatus Woesearchaeota archaeon]
ILAIVAVHLKTKGKLDKDTVITTVMANSGFDEAMKENGITVVRTAVGDRYVVEEMHKNSYTLGGEQSGHIVFGKHATTGDGTLTALQILSIMHQTKKTLSELAKIMSVYPQIILNILVKEKKPLEKMPRIQTAIQHIEKEIKGRVFVRYSGTQNMCRIMIEGKSKDQITKSAEELAKIIKEELGI